MNEHAAGGEIRGPIHDPDSVPFFLSPTSVPDPEPPVDDQAA
jgi:hypothetical protein